MGDAAGRAKDHSDGDRKWAENVGIKFVTPEVRTLSLPSASPSQKEDGTHPVGFSPLADVLSREGGEAATAQGF